jgi:hypothetical protein
LTLIRRRRILLKRRKTNYNLTKVIRDKERITIRRVAEYWGLTPNPMPIIIIIIVLRGIEPA